MTDTDAKAQKYFLLIRLIEKVKQYAQDGDYISESEVVRKVLHNFCKEFERKEQVIKWKKRGEGKIVPKRSSLKLAR